MSILRKFISMGILLISLNVFSQALQNDAPTTNPADLQTRKQAIVGTIQSKINSSLEVFPGTQSNKYEWLESVSQKRGDFLEKTKSEAQTKLSSLSQQKKIEDFLMPKPAEEETDESAAEISETRQIKIMTKNFVRTIYDIDGENKKVILTNQDFAPKQAYFHGLFPSADKKFVGVVVALNGSIDNVLVKIYDVTKKEFTHDFECFSGDFAMHWFSNTQVIYTHAQTTSKGETTVIENVVTGEQIIKINHGALVFNDWIGFSNFANDDVYLQNSKTGTTLLYNGLVIANFSTENETHFFLIDSYNRDFAGGIYKLEKINGAKLTTFAFPLENTNLNTVEIVKREGLSDVLIAQYSRDAEATVIVYKLDGSVETKVKFPANLWLATVGYDKDSKSYTFDVTNVNGNATVLKLALGESVLSIPDEAYAPKKDAAFEVVSRIEYFKSADGELIPARITHKKDLVISGSNPVYMEAYGGFMLAGYLKPVKSKMTLEFIKRGGIAVGTGVRGGNERGRAWYEAGAGKNKINTPLDLIAIANGLVERSYTQPSKITITGTSSGGFTVASAGRLSPESFGLVIPVNGVQDQLDFSSLDRWGIGWEDDFLNPYNAKNYPYNAGRSPLEIKFQNQLGAEYLIVNGENDTRVNKVHSYKLKALLDDNAPGKSILFSVEKAGHWPLSTYLIDTIGIHSSSVVWAKIFDASGLEF